MRKSRTGAARLDPKPPGVGARLSGHNPQTERLPNPIQPISGYRESLPYGPTQTHLLAATTHDYGFSLSGAKYLDESLPSPLTELPSAQHLVGPVGHLGEQARRHLPAPG